MLLTVRSLHVQVSRAGIERLMAATGLVLDEAMASSDGTYLMLRP